MVWNHIAIHWRCKSAYSDTWLWCQPTPTIVGLEVHMGRRTHTKVFWFVDFAADRWVSFVWWQFCVQLWHRQCTLGALEWFPAPFLVCPIHRSVAFLRTRRMIAMQRSRNLEENRQKIGLKSQSRVAYSRARANWKIYAGMNTHWFRNVVNEGD